jgi:hypothetical protein
VTDDSTIRDQRESGPGETDADRADAAADAASANARTPVAEPATATLELRWSLAERDANGFTDIEIMQDWAGANRGPVRDENWVKIPVGVAPARPLRSEPGGVVAALGTLPAGAYDRIHVAAIDVRGRDANGMWVSFVNHIEPIARGFEVEPSGHLAITIDLVVRPPSSAGDGRSEMFVRDARLTATSAGPDTRTTRKDNG